MAKSRIQDMIERHFLRATLPTLEREAKAAEAALQARVAAHDRWHAAEARKAEIPAAAAKVRAAEAEYHEARALHQRRLYEARRELQQLRSSIEGEQRRAESVLLHGDDPNVVAAAEVLSMLHSARLHVQRHVGSERELEERIRRYDGVPDAADLHAAATKDLAGHLAAEKALPLFDAAMDQLRAVQLEPEFNLADVVSEAIKDVPRKCPSCNCKLVAVYDAASHTPGARVYDYGIDGDRATTGKGKP